MRYRLRNAIENLQGLIFGECLYNLIGLCRTFVAYERFSFFKGNMGRRQLF